MNTQALSDTSTEAFMKGNPFSDAFVKQEYDFYGVSENYKKDGLRVIQQNVIGRCDDYLNKNFRVGMKSLALIKEGDVWMSLTPMEIESNYLHIFEAEGQVFTGGLGLGYFPLRAAAKESVESVVVYETDKRVIDFFKSAHSARKELEKIEIRESCWREALRSGDIEYHDYIYSDIYPYLCDDDILDDIREFHSSFQFFRFWGMEKVIVSAAMSYGHQSHLLSTWGNLRPYLKKWLDNEEKTSLYYPAPDEDYCLEITKLLEI